VGTILCLGYAFAGTAAGQAALATAGVLGAAAVGWVAGELAANAPPVTGDTSVGGSGEFAGVVAAEADANAPTAPDAGPTSADATGDGSTDDVGPPHALNGVRLRKQLASEEQMNEAGSVLAGSDSKTELRDAPRLANQYGGNAEDWEKRGSSSYDTNDQLGTKHETHWYENKQTGQRVEYKTKIQRPKHAPKSGPN
jgi:hypothetical protein